MLVELGRKIGSAREERGESLQVVAQAAKISASYLQKLERGVVNSPSPRVLRRLAAVLELAYLRLMELAGYLDEEGTAVTRRVATRRPSFPSVEPDTLLTPEAGVRWQVACGDHGHWRVGFYSPGETSVDEIAELEQHDCPEFFLLLSGRVRLVLGEADGGFREVGLRPGRPILVDAPHCGFCPDGPHTGVALVVERDAFETIYTDFKP